MPIPEELVRLAHVALNDGNSGEAALRRATSIAYYGLFHLLVRDATGDRPLFGRILEHNKMKAACYKVAGVSLRP